MATWKAPEPVNEPINPFLARLQGIAPNINDPEVVPDNYGQTFEPASVFGTAPAKNADGFSIPSPGETGT
jgi:hypothetical protein